MKKHEIKIGGLYTARVSGKYATVRVDSTSESGGYSGARTVTLYNVTNLTTGRKTTFRSAAKFRSEVVKTGIVDNTKETPHPLPAGGSSSTDSPSDPSVGLPDQEDEQCRPPTHHTDVNDVDEKTVPAMQSVGTVVEDEEGEQCSDPTSQMATSEQLQSAKSVGSHSTPTALETNGVLSATDHVQVATTDGEQSLPFVASGVDTAMSADSKGVHGVASKIAERIAAAQAAEPDLSGLTQQQRDILATAREVETERGNGQRVMVIGAGAGTGKTFTLKQLEQVLHGNGQYTAFNSSLVAESKAKFKRAACNTTHSLAFRAVGHKFKHRLNGARIRSYEVAQRLGIKDYTVELPEAVAPYDDGKPQVRQLKAQFLAGQVTQAIRKFCQSADAEIAAKHIDYFPGLDEPRKYDNSNRVKEYLIPFVQAAWADLKAEDGNLQFHHDVYVKLWELGRGQDRPVIAADYILLDEAQDTAPVMLSILQQQTHALLVLVGDDCQQIYEWRGACNAMKAFPVAPRKLLSQSFRFGQAVADVANTVLAGLEEPTDLVMTGLPSIPTRVCKVDKPTCYLYRTNAGAVGKLMSGMEEGKRGYLIGGSDEVIKFCRAALDLQRGRGTTHPELGCFTKWSEVQEYSKEAEGADLRLMVKLIDTFRAEKIIAALDNMPPEDRADFVTSTAHRSKGREWPSVKLGPDFPTANNLTDSDRRLVYVAATRAQEELDITECPTFCGGYDKQGGGEDGEGGAEWVPGIEIEYTVPMPSADDLAAYRAAKSAPMPPATAPVSPAGPIPASAAPDAAAADVATANGNPVAPAQVDCRAAGDNTWAKGKNGDWLVRGKVGQTGTVTVARKNGTTSKETIKRVVWHDASIALYEV